MKGHLWSSLSAMLMCVLLMNDAAAEALDVDSLMKQLAASTYSTAHFTEHKFLRSLNQPLELSGILKYESRDHFVKQTLEPRQETLTIDKGTLTIERKGKTRSLQLQDYPAMQGFIECIRDTMSGDLSGLRQNYSLQLDGDLRHWQLTLLPKDVRLLKVIQTVLISGSDGHVNTVEIRETKGDRSVMNIVRDEK